MLELCEDGNVRAVLAQHLRGPLHYDINRMLDRVITLLSDK